MGVARACQGIIGRAIALPALPMARPLIIVHDINWLRTPLTIPVFDIINRVGVAIIGVTIAINTILVLKFTKHFYKLTLYKSTSSKITFLKNASHPLTRLAYFPLNSSASIPDVEAKLSKKSDIFSSNTQAYASQRNFCSENPRKSNKLGSNYKTGRKNNVTE